MYSTIGRALAVIVRTFSAAIVKGRRARNEAVRLQPIKQTNECYRPDFEDFSECGLIDPFVLREIDENSASCAGHARKPRAHFSRALLYCSDCTTAEQSRAAAGQLNWAHPHRDHLRPAMPAVRKRSLATGGGWSPRQSCRDASVVARSARPRADQVSVRRMGAGTTPSPGLRSWS
jgi:hypothetical protein